MESIKGCKYFNSNINFPNCLKILLFGIGIPSSSVSGIKIGFYTNRRQMSVVTPETNEKYFPRD